VRRAVHAVGNEFTLVEHRSWRRGRRHVHGREGLQTTVPGPATAGASASFEIFVIDDEARKLIYERVAFVDPSRARAGKWACGTLREDGVRKVLAG